MKEPTGGCCVCLDERGWSENKLVYCDGRGCNVAVHQACYGITRIPSGSWFCRKCESQERVARVRCELCPSKEGALKRTDTGGWAHVVCALYIPEVAFGDVSTMEPILMSRVTRDKYGKVCYLCVQQNRQSDAGYGACIKCAKPSCRIVFHVTCAQSAGFLREELLGPGSSTYKGYCSAHADQNPALPLYSSTSSDSTANIDSVPSSQERKEAYSHLTTDTMSQDDEREVGVRGNGCLSDSKSQPSSNLSLLPATSTKALLSSKVKRNAAAKVKAKSVRHQRVLKRGGGKKPLPSSKRPNKSRDGSVESKSDDLDKDVEPAVGGKEGNGSADDAGHVSRDNSSDSLINSELEREEKLPATLEEFLELQLQKGRKCLLDELGQCDAATLLTTLKRLQAENKELTGEIDQLTQRKEHLLELNRSLSSLDSSGKTSSLDTACISSDTRYQETTKRLETVQECQLIDARVENTTEAAKEDVPEDSIPSANSLEKNLPNETKGNTKPANGDTIPSKTSKVSTKRKRSTAKNSKLKTSSISKTSLPYFCSSMTMESESPSQVALPIAVTSSVSGFTSSVSGVTNSVFEEQTTPPSGSQTQFTLNRKRRSTGDRGKKKRSSADSFAELNTSPTLQQVGQSHSVSCLLDHNHACTPFYPSTTFGVSSLLSSQTSASSYDLPNRLFYSQHPLVHDSVNCGMPLTRAFSTDYTSSRSPDPSGVLGMSSLRMHGMSSSLPFYSGRPT